MDKEVTVKSKDGKIDVIATETILVAMGRQANLKTLGLENIGVEFDNKGLKLR